MRKEHTPFYFNEEFDGVLRECDNERSEKIQAEYSKRELTEGGYNGSMTQTLRSYHGRDC